MDELPLRVLRLAPDSVVDGDTLRLPDPAPQDWGALAARLRLGSDGRVVLRLSGLDAPESFHPGAPPGLQSQPAAACALCLAALRSMLDGASGGSLAVALTGVDRYGRALALVWPGARRGTPEDSLNARLVAAGAAYPDLHQDLPSDFALRLSALAAKARARGLGLWPLDLSASGVDLRDWDQLSGQLVLPRLFRRIGAFWRLQPAPTAGLDDCFREFLEQRGDWLRPLAGGPARPFAEWLEIRDGHCRITAPVENFLYQSGVGTEKLT